MLPALVLIAQVASSPPRANALRVELDFGLLDRAPAIDTILLKASYFFGGN